MIGVVYSMGPVATPTGKENSKRKTYAKAQQVLKVHNLLMNSFYLSRNKQKY